MNTKVVVILSALAGIFVVAALAVAGGCYWYLYGASSEDSADFLPSGTLFYTYVENGTALAVDARSTKLEQIISMQKTQDAINQGWQTLSAEDRAILLKGLSNLSGQSFVAFTSYNVLSPTTSTGILGFRPKPGLDTFSSTVDDLIKKATDQDTGNGVFSGITYRWVQKKGDEPGPRICFATVGAWDVCAVGETELQDWVNRYQKNSKTPALGQNPEYQLTMKRLGNHNVVKSFINVPEIINETKLLIPPNITKIPLEKIGAVALGSSIAPGGNISDRLVWDLPKSAQDSLGHYTAPCAYETEKFTAQETLLYAAGSVDLQTMWDNIKTQMANNPAAATNVQTVLQNMQSMGVDMDKNIVQALGDEASIQMDWPSDQEFPQAAVFIKVKDQTAFQPVHTSLDLVTRLAGQSVPIAVGSQHLASLNLPGMVAFSPTYTTDGPFFALFTSKEEAQKCFQQDASKTVATRPEFSAPGGSVLGTSSQAGFVDFAQITQNVAHSHPIMDYLSNKDEDKALYSALSDPDQLNTLSSLGIWAGTATWDDEGLTYDSTSSVGSLPLLMASVAAAAQRPDLQGYSH